MGGESCLMDEFPGMDSFPKGLSGANPSEAKVRDRLGLKYGLN